jgi:hypothetical protein
MIFCQKYILLIKLLISTRTVQTSIAAITKFWGALFTGTSYHRSSCLSSKLDRYNRSVDDSLQRVTAVSLRPPHPDLTDPKAYAQAIQKTSISTAHECSELPCGLDCVETERLDGTLEAKDSIYEDRDDREHGRNGHG